MSKTSPPSPNLSERRDVAQRKLINTAIRHGVHALYADAQARSWEVNTTVDGRKLGKTEEDVVRNLCAIPNEFERARNFSLLAKQNAFDLTIKSAGAKTAHSIRRKQNIPGMPSAPLTDEVRISVVSSNLQLLNDLSQALEADLRPASEPRGLPTKMECWYMRTNALLHQILKTSVDGFGAEIQFLPREQARMATRITHHFLKIIRTYDDVTKSLEDKPDVKDYMTSLADLASSGDTTAAQEIGKITRKIKQANTMILDYNELADFLNHLTRPGAKLGVKDMERFNGMLHNLDRSSLTLDEQGEVTHSITSSANAARTPHFSPVFKTTHDFLSYKKFMSEKGTEIGLFPLPLLAKESQKDEIEFAIDKLRQCSQLTHACYMNEALEPMRQLWVEKALSNNQHLAADKQIPANAIAWVQGSLDVNVADQRGKTNVR